MKNKLKNNLPRILMVVGLLVLILAVSRIFIGATTQVTSVPDLTLVDLNGKSVSLTDFRGKTVLVNNFATWCPPCRQEMPDLQLYYEKYKDQGFMIVAIEAGQPKEEVQKFVDTYKLTFIVLPDPEQQAVRVFRNNALPNSTLIGRDGKIIRSWSGAVSLEQLEQIVTPVMAN